MGNVLEVMAQVDPLTGAARRGLLEARQLREEAMGPRGTIETLRNGQGQSIAAYLWPVPNPRGIAVLVHGQGSYLLFEYGSSAGAGRPRRYAGSWIEAMNNARYSVAGIDNQGAGRSDGLFGFIPSFDGLVADLLQLCRTLRGPGAPPGFGRGLPVFGVAASLGGCIALHASLQQPSLFNGLVLLAPLLSLERVKRAGANRLLVPLSFLLSYVIPTLPIIATGKNAKFPHLRAEFEADPATFSFPARLGTATELMRACDAASNRLGAVTTPFLVFHSDHDTMTDPDGSRALFARAKVADKTHRAVNEMWHCLTREPGHEMLLSEAIAWMDARVAPA